MPKFDNFKCLPVNFDTNGVGAAGQRSCFEDTLHHICSIAAQGS